MAERDANAVRAELEEAKNLVYDLTRALDESPAAEQIPDLDVELHRQRERVVALERELEQLEGS
jgi:hypothetical protein